MAPHQTGWPVWRVARTVTSVFVLMVASYYLVVAFDNFTNPTNPNASNWPFVQGVLSGDGVPAESGFEWRFIDATWFQAASYIGIMAMEAITGTLLLISGVLGLRRARIHESWAAVQRWTYVGGIAGLAVFFFGFVVVGGNWFIMYLNSTWNGLEPAFQNSVVTLSMLILVSGVLVGSQMSSARLDESV
jgi:predicted small integral membrane protein